MIQRYIVLVGYASLTFSILARCVINLKGTSCWAEDSVRYADCTVVTVFVARIRFFLSLLSCDAAGFQRQIRCRDLALALTYPVYTCRTCSRYNYARPTITSASAQFRYDFSLLPNVVFAQHLNLFMLQRCIFSFLKSF